MPAPKGNQFWQNVQFPGRPREFESPRKLWLAALRYFNWMDTHPQRQDKQFCYQGDIIHDDAIKMNPYTLGELCAFIGIDKRNFDRYGDLEDFRPITTAIREIIYGQKFRGAAADIFNANIIARELGLTDKAGVDITSGGERIRNEWHVHPVTTEMFPES